MRNEDFRATVQGRLFSLPRWAVPFVLAGAVGVGLVLFLLAASLALIVVPLAIAGGAFAAWRIRRQLRRAGVLKTGMHGEPLHRRGAHEADIIDVDYRVIDRADRR